MSDQATATENGKPALPAIADEEIQKIRAKGAALVAYRQEVQSIAKQIAGMEWGGSLSPATQYSLAQFARITGANIQLHIDVLGGKPYLNANFWSDRINSDPHYHSHTQREISAGSEERLRERAAALLAEAEDLDPKDKARSVKLSRALDLEEEAEEVWRLRQHYGIPDDAEAAYETTIKRFINAAPMDAIQRGDITDLEHWLTEVSEANWAGGKAKDPVGNQNPERTARTRSLRRCAARAFTAWLSRYDEQIRKAEEAIEAEFTVLEEDAAERRALQAGPQGASTDGEPAAAAGADAEDLPGTRAPTPREDAPETEEEWDREKARKRYFAMLHESGVADSKRKAWQKAHELPVSTSDWTRADYNKAFEALIAPHRDAYFELCEQKGVDAEDFAFEEIHALPGSVADFQKLNGRLADLDDAPLQGELVS